MVALIEAESKQYSYHKLHSNLQQCPSLDFHSDPPLILTCIVPFSKLPEKEVHGYWKVMQAAKP